jgi:hypothetical protein
MSTWYENHTFYPSKLAQHAPKKTTHRSFIIPILSLIVSILSILSSLSSLFNFRIARGGITLKRPPQPYVKRGVEHG